MELKNARSQTFTSGPFGGCGLPQMSHPSLAAREASDAEESNWRHIDATVLQWQLHFFPTALNVLCSCRHAFLSDLVRFGHWRLDDCSPALLPDLSVTSAGSLEVEEVNTKDEPPDDPPDKPEVLERGETSLS